MVEGRACSGSVACDAAGRPQFCGSGRGAGFPENRSISRVVVAGLHVGAIAVQLFWVGRKLRWARVWTRTLRRCVKGWPPWKQEFNDAGISGYGSTDGCDHFVRGRQSLWTSQPGIAGTIRSKRGAGVENRSGWSSVYRDRWRPARDFLLRGMRGIADCDYFKTRGNAKSKPEQSAIEKNRRLPATHDFSYIAWTRMFRCHHLRV